MTEPTLADFLLARVAEREAAARAATPGPWTNDGGIYAGHPHNEVVDYAYDDNAAHIALNDPAYVLADCEAKRRIVELHRHMETAPACATCGGFTYQGTPRGIEHHGYLTPWPCTTLRLLALPHADHPHYRPEWRP